MSLLLFLVILILLIVILVKISSTKTSTDNLNRTIHNLDDRIKALNEKINLMQWDKKIVQQVSPIIEKKEREIPKPAEEIKPVFKPVITEKPLPIKPVEEPLTETTAQQFPGKESKEEVPAAQLPLQPVKESWFQTWLKNNPDMEKFIGENLINKIGIAVLILGIAFFVKYAIDQDWINETGRVCIGLFCGIILIFVAHRLRKNYRSFSSVLVGGGLTVFYFTIAFAFHQYNLISQSAAFIIMVIITAFAVTLSLLYDRLELAILATIGGFITPFLVSTGEGNYVILFTYLCILNSGLIVLAFYKRWHALHFIAFAFTALIYGAWIGANNSSKTFSYSGTFLFGTVFYLMFLIINMLLYLKKEVKFSFPDVSLLILTNVGYYSAGIFLLHQWHPEYKGLFTAILGVVNLLLATFFYKRKNIDRNFIYLLIGVTLTFISLAAPVQLEGNYITIFWAAELVLLFWLYQKSFIRLLKIASVFITILMLISLLMDWEQVYVIHSNLLTVIINKGFTTTVFCAVSMGVMAYLMKKEADSFYLKGISNNAMQLFYTITSVVLFFISGVLEICYQFSTRYSGTGLQYTYLLLYIPAFILVLILLLPVLKIKTGYFTQPFLAAAAIVYYLLNIGNSYTTERLLLQTNSLQWHFLAHWAGIVLLLLLIYKMISLVRQQHDKLKELLPAFTCITAIIVIIFFSVEIKNIYVWLVYQNPNSFTDAENLYNKAGLSIVWGLLSFTCIWLGMRYGFKTLRVIALVLFGVTLIKLFVFDLKNIPPGGKIVAFILLGVLLLTVSFMYQRLKKLIIDDTDEKE